MELFEMLLSSPFARPIVEFVPNLWNSCAFYGALLENIIAI